MKNENSISKILPVLFGFFIMGFCDVVGITSTHVKADFGLSDTMSNMIPVALFSMFLLFSVPTGDYSKIYLLATGTDDVKADFVVDSQISTLNIQK